MQVPIFDGSAREWVEAIEQVGLQVATDHHGDCCEKMIAYVNEPVHVWRNDSFVAAFPSEEIRITYGIDFRQVLAWKLLVLIAWMRDGYQISMHYFVVFSTSFVRNCMLIHGVCPV